jgi:hypothetical protein
MTAVPEHARHALAAPIPQPAGTRHRQAARGTPGIVLAGLNPRRGASLRARTGEAACG